MRAWDETDDLLRRATERRDADHEETLRDLDAEGVSLDPPPPGQHRHDDDDHPSDHEHPHVHSAPGERPVVGIVGAGCRRDGARDRADRAGWPVGAVASPRPGPAAAVPRPGRRAPAGSPRPTPSWTTSSS